MDHIIQPASKQCFSRFKSNGYIVRMAQHCISRRLLYRDVLCGRKHQGQPKEWYSITIKTNFHWCKIRPKELEKCATDWLRWCAIVYQPLQTLNKACHQKINIQKEPCHYATLVLVIITNFQCSYYSRFCVQTWFADTHSDPLINYKTKSSFWPDNNHENIVRFCLFVFFLYCSY